MIGADAIAKCLIHEGVDTIFGYSGVAIDPFWNSVGKENIKTVLVRTEQNAGHAASGYARTLGKVGVCAVTSGPGATNLLTGIATAYADSIPLVCITGQVNTDQIGSDVFQEADVTGAAESFVKYSYLIRDVRDIPRIIHEAFYVASTGRRGPVLIDIPCDIQLKKIPDFEYPEGEPKMRTYKPTIKGNAVQIKKVIKVLENAKKPLIIAGGGVFLSGAKKELRAFVEKHSIPVVSTMMGLGVLPSDHPLYYGMVGNNGNAYANRALRECDTLLMVGARVADRAVATPDMTFDGKILIHMDVDPAEIGKNVGPTIPIVGDIRHIFEDFLESDFGDRHDTWVNMLDLYRDSMKEERHSSTEYVNPQTFVRKLCMALNEKYIYVADVGQNQLFSCRNVIMRDGGKFFTSGGMGTMGYSIPAAMGAKAAEPDTQVVAVCGDGSFQMSMMELATINQYKFPVKIVVMRNRYLGLVREHQHHDYNGEYNMVFIGDEPDLQKIAEAYNVGYFKADNMKDIDEMIREFLDGDTTSIMEIMIDPEENVAGV
ncbi:MAG: biosynthetic-type acetolactate synthase large subunit [Lachnospiraceae bacterium]|nr:biosynthetic-type acetolactate synthase large subunit [Lachnospiraceae bacterium]